MALTMLDSSWAPQVVYSTRFIVEALTSFLNTLGDKSNDIADWTPNPFKGWNTANNPSANETRLTLVDGGEDLQNVPSHPHLFR